jgi:hypothetical protein
MKRQAVNRNDSKAAKLLSPIRVRDGEPAPKNDNVRWRRVGDWWIPISTTRPITIPAQQDGKTVMVTIHAEESRLPVASVAVPSEVKDDLNRESHRIYESWRSLFELADMTNHAHVGFVVCNVGSSIDEAIEAGFYLALLRYADDLKNVPEAVALLEQRKEHGELLAAEGRAAKAVIDRDRADLICRIYTAIRPSFPDGRKGNGLAHRAVAERYEMRTRQTVSERTVRDTVKKAGLSAPHRRKRKN